MGNGELDQALAECRSLATVYETDNGCGLDHVAVLRLLAKVGHRPSNYTRRRVALTKDMANESPRAFLLQVGWKLGSTTQDHVRKMFGYPSDARKPLRFEIIVGHVARL